MEALMLMGEGTRLAGKPFLKVRGKPLFLYGWETLSKLFDKVLVSCTPKVEEKLKTFKVDYVVDEKMLGPLSGILSGFKVLSSEYAFVLGCDMPLIRGDVLSHLMGKLRGDGLVLEHEDGFIEPLHAFYAREKSTEVLEKLLPEKRRVRELAGNLDVLKYPTQKLRLFDQELYFLRNINTKEDLSWLEKSVGVL